MISQIYYFFFFLLSSCLSFFASVSMTVPAVASMCTSVTLPSAPKISTSQTVLPCFFSSSTSTTVPGTFSIAVLIACSAVILASLTRSPMCASLSSLNAAVPDPNSRVMVKKPVSACVRMEPSFRWECLVLLRLHVRRRHRRRAAHMGVTLPGAVRIRHAAAIAFAALFVLLHHLLVFGLLFRPLLRSQQAQDLAARLDRRHSQRNLHVFTLAQFRLNGLEVGLLVIGHGL